MATQLKLKDMLADMVRKGGTDLHLSAGSAPRIRVDGVLKPTSDPALSVSDAESLCFEFASDDIRRRFKEHHEVDFSFGVEGVSRIRANLYLEKNSIAGAFRSLPFKVPDPKDLFLPEGVQEIIHRRHGLVLVTGATGSGKSTTIASLINQINQSRKEHIITVEDPIEFVFEHGSCMVHQREVNSHTESFQTALKYILRQDPDIVLIGEMRDLETIQAAITVAETGHLVFATLHTNTAVQSIDRIIDVFPPFQQPQIRSQLSFILLAVLSQHLLPLKTGGRRLALEMLFPNHAIRNLIREGKTHQIYSQMQSGQQVSGMRTMNQSLVDLVNSNLVDAEAASEFSPDLQEFNQLLEKAQLKKVVGS